MVWVWRFSVSSTVARGYTGWWTARGTPSTIWRLPTIRHGLHVFLMSEESGELLPKRRLNPDSLSLESITQIRHRTYLDFSESVSGWSNFHLLLNSLIKDLKSQTQNNPPRSGQES